MFWDISANCLWVVEIWFFFLYFWFKKTPKLSKITIKTSGIEIDRINTSMMLQWIYLFSCITVKSRFSYICVVKNLNHYIYVFFFWKLLWASNCQILPNFSFIYIYIFSILLFSREDFYKHGIMHLVFCHLTLF